MIGDDRPFLTALLVLDADVAPAWAAQQGIEDTCLEALAGDERVRTRSSAGVEAANSQVSNVEGVKKFTILGTDWLPGGDELTPTMKLKRKPVGGKYAAQIEAMYARYLGRLPRWSPDSPRRDSGRRDGMPWPDGPAATFLDSLLQDSVASQAHGRTGQGPGQALEASRGASWSRSTPR